MAIPSGKYNLSNLPCKSYVSLIRKEHERILGEEEECLDYYGNLDMWIVWLNISKESYGAKAKSPKYCSIKKELLDLAGMVEMAVSMLEAYPRPKI